MRTQLLAAIGGERDDGVLREIQAIERGENSAEIVVDPGAVSVEFRKLLARGQFIIGRNVSTQVQPRHARFTDVLWMGKRDLYCEGSTLERFYCRVRRQRFQAAEDLVVFSRCVGKL